MQNLSLVKRTQHVTAIYKNKRLTLDMNLGFDVMDVRTRQHDTWINISTTIYISYDLHLCNFQFSYEYYLKHLLVKRQGDVYGRLYELNVNVLVTVDLNEYYLILDSIKFTSVR